ncbi:hypothetical protein B0H17DRAFT_408017 [Mycena rosella]|uniref:Uncharacterized protein n=1 Tax=Mycena rosella TaxID=1033263 RepID=A0AAD7G2C6_MYCRO|nr:hypothetical protein B0H17DRAFT_408017 [Mycena rosella]
MGRPHPRQTTSYGPTDIVHWSFSSVRRRSVSEREVFLVWGSEEMDTHVDPDVEAAAEAEADVLGCKLLVLRSDREELLLALVPLALGPLIWLTSVPPAPDGGLPDRVAGTSLFNARCDSPRPSARGSQRVFIGCVALRSKTCQCSFTSRDMFSSGLGPAYSKMWLQPRRPHVFRNGALSACWAISALAAGECMRIRTSRRIYTARWYDDG